MNLGKSLKRMALVAAMLLVFAGCNTAGDSSGTPSQTDPGEGGSSSAALAGRVSTNGSTSMEKVIGALSESFMGQNSGVDITYDPTGSGAGITAVKEGTADIGLSSRALKDSELADGLTGITIALDGIAIVVNNNNPVDDLSLEQIAALADGTYTNWSEVGGDDAPVVFIGREAGSGTRDGFESIVGVADACVYDQELTSTGAVIAGVASNPNAIGYASLSSVSDQVKAISVEGVEATEATVLSGTYKVQRPFVMVVKSGAALSEQAQAFVDYATSPAAKDIIAAAGAVQA